MDSLDILDGTKEAGSDTGESARAREDQDAVHQLTLCPANVTNQTRLLPLS
jgi:hypothetical protein